MRNLAAIVAGVFTVLAAAPALAQPACTTTGMTGAQGITGGDPSQVMIAYLGTSPIMKAELVEAAKRPLACRRAVIPVGSQTYVVGGEDTDAIPRRVLSGDPNGPVVVLAATAPNGPAPAPGTVRFAYALIKIDATNLSLMATYDRIPDDALFIRGATAVLTNPNLRPMVLVNRATGQPTMNVSGPAPAGGQAPAAGNAQSGPRRLTGGPDGVVFVDAGNGAARHVRTGFICPASINGVARRDMVIYNPADGGRDVGCGYGLPSAGGTWYTLYLAQDTGQTTSQYLDNAVREAHRTVASVGDGPVLAPTGPAPLPTVARWWKTQAGGGTEGVAVSTIDNWHVSLRISAGVGQEAEAGRMIRTIFQQFYSQVKPTPSTAPLQIPGPDGKFWVDTGGGNARHALTGFECPMTMGGVARRNLQIRPAGPPNANVGCGYGQPGSNAWYTVILGNTPNVPVDALVNSVAESGRQSLPPVSEATTPLPYSAAGPAGGSFWKTANGATEGVWVAAEGDWRLVVRVTIRPGFEAEAAAFAAELFRRFHEQIRAAPRAR